MAGSRPGKKTLVFRSDWALGDLVCMSALIRDIHRAYPGKYETLATGHYSGVFWKNNPYCEAMKGNVNGQVIRLDYANGIREAGHGVKRHFLAYFHKAFTAQTGIRVPVTEPKGDIHLTDKERKQNFPGRYWVVVAGGKKDMPVKVWDAARFQQVIDVLAAQGISCLQAGAEFHNHFHPKLKRCVSAVGKTNNERDFFSLIYNAEGVICGITAAMHIAAVFDKPCVVIAGGREEPWWEAYSNCWPGTQFGPKCAPVKVPHRYLHTIGHLDCGIGNLQKGCWRSKLVSVTNNKKRDIKLCTRVARSGHQALPECMKMITVDHVVEAVMSYYEDGTLPPIGEPSRRYALPVAETVETPADEWIPFDAKPVLPETKKKKDDVLDHPIIGGKMTVFVLGYGDYKPLLERCIESILETVPQSRRELRVALNQPSVEMRDYVSGFSAKDISSVYVDEGSRRKYPAMREMFHDKKHPITTPYSVWFDDDSWCRHGWFTQLAECIVKNHSHGHRLYGVKFIHDLSIYQRKGKKPLDWFRAAKWWRNKPLFMDKGRRVGPNGSEIPFVGGSFWAIASDVIRECDIPDARIQHNGDPCIGAQVMQHGYKICDFARGKTPVCWSDHARRGVSTPFPWAQ